MPDSISRVRRGAVFPSITLVSGASSVALLASFFFALGALTGASACGITADFSGIQGGVRPGAPSFDAAPPIDATAPPTDGIAGGSFCATLGTTPHLCADFDESPQVQSGWSFVDQYPNGQTVSIDTVAYSQPGSFLTAVVSSQEPTSARLEEVMPTLSKKVHMECRMLLQPSDGNFEVLVLHQQTPDGFTHGLFYKEEAGELVVYMRGISGDGGIINYVHKLGKPTATWMHVEIDIVVADDGSLRVKHDDQIVVDEPHIATSTPTRTMMFVDLGFYSSEGKPARANFDNVVIDWE